MIARSSTVDGWYEGYAGNPIITHRHLGWEYPIDNVGHADFVDTPDGNWYAVMLASRIIDGQHKNFGRETYICPVKWERGWPVLSPGSGRMEFSYPADDKLPWTPYPGEPERDDFDTPELGLHFSFWGVPYQDFWRVEDGSLKLKCLPRPIIRQLKGFNVAEPDQSRDDCISLLGRRQRDTDFDVTMSLDFTPKGKEAAGLIVMQAANHQFRLEKTLSNGKEVPRLIMVTTKQEGLPFLPGYKADTTEQILEEKEVPAGKLILRMEVRRQAHRFFFGCDENNLTAFETVGDGALINPEEVGGMIGTIIAMFATANGDESDNWAKFDFFEMKKV
jgi:alpha-N-arabinofuranosidase